METGNYVARLNEHAQKTGHRPRYEDLGSVGPEHDKIFTQRVVFDGKFCPDGVGKTKKEAKQSAAKNALKFLLENKHQDPDDLTNAAAEASTAANHHASSSCINYICWLNEHCQRQRLTLKSLESTIPGPNNTVQCCSFVVNETEYPAGHGNTKKEAKEEAAKFVYDIICGTKTEAAVENHNNTSGQQHGALTQDVFSDVGDLSMNSRDISFAEENFIGIVNRYCQEKNHSHTYIEVRRCGPPHKLQFFYKVVINNKEYPVGDGMSIKQAKQKAAQLAWSALQELSDWDSKVSSRSTTSDDDAPSTTQESYESSRQRNPTNISESIIFRDSSNPSSCQGSALSKSDASSSMSITPSKESQSKVTDFDSVIDSSNQTDDQAAVESNSMGYTLTRPSYSFSSNFDSITPLGKGGFGHVYKAREKLVDKHYAIKIVRGNNKALREVTVLSDLQHPNIVRYYHCWMEDSNYKDQRASSQAVSNLSQQYLYIKMELCDNKTLEAWIKERNTMPLPDSKRGEESIIIAQQIVNGVEYIHSRKHFHRDLKPVNIMFGLDGKVKIGDFGLVTAEADDDDENLIERTNTGTKSYMAPEQLKEKNYGRKVDIFALGLIYLELLCRFDTYQERAVTFTNARSQIFPKELASSFPYEKKLIKSMLCAKPEDRPEANAVKKQLEQWSHRSLPEANVTV